MKPFYLLSKRFRPLISLLIIGLLLCLGSKEGYAQQGATLDFDGVNDKVTLPNLNSTLNTVTIEAWIYPDGTQNDYAGIVFNRPSNYSHINGLHFTTGGKIGYTWKGAHYDWTGGPDYVPNQWQHVALVIEPSQATIYHNGTPYKNTTPHLSSNLSNVVLGQDVIVSDRHFNGKMDEVRIWSTARSATQINNQKDAELTGAEAGLVAYYQFNQGLAGQTNTAEKTLNDSSPQNYNGSLTGFSLTGTASNWIAPGAVSSATATPPIVSADYFDVNHGSFTIQNLGSGAFKIHMGLDRRIKTGTPYTPKELYWKIETLNQSTSSYAFESWNYPGNYLEGNASGSITYGKKGTPPLQDWTTWITILNPPDSNNEGYYYTIKNKYSNKFLGIENDRINVSDVANTKNYHWDVKAVPSPGVPDVEVSGLEVTELIWDWDMSNMTIKFKQVSPITWDYFRDDEWFGRLTEVSRTENEIQLKDDDRDRQTFRFDLDKGRVWSSDHGTTNNLFVGYLLAANASGESFDLGDVNGLNITQAITEDQVVYRQIGPGKWQQLFLGGGANVLTETGRTGTMVYLASAAYNMEIDLSSNKIFYKQGSNTTIIPAQTQTIATTSKENGLMGINGQNVKMVMTSADDNLIEIGPNTWRSLRGGWLIYKVISRDASSVVIKHMTTDYTMKIDLDNWKIFKVENGTDLDLGSIVSAQTSHNHTNQIQAILDIGESFKAPIALYNSGIPLSEIYGKNYRGGLIYHLDLENEQVYSGTQVIPASTTTASNAKGIFLQYYGDAGEITFTESMDEESNDWLKYVDGEFASSLSVISKNATSIVVRDQNEGANIRINFQNQKVYRKKDNEAAEQVAGFLAEADENYIAFETKYEILPWDLSEVFKYIKAKTTQKKLPFCWRQSFGRGVGKLADACKDPSWEKDATGGPAGFCYPKCDSGYDGVGPVCWQSCPSGFRDDGAFCRKPDEYGRGVGRVPDVSCPSGFSQRGIGALAWCDNRAFWPWDLETRSAIISCKSSEEMNGALCYPKCKAGYHNVGCCICSYDCPSGFGTDIGVSCTKKTYGRGVGIVADACKGDGWEKDPTGGPAGLCYQKCGDGFHGVGPVCWQDCPSGMSDCGAGCASSGVDCGITITEQVLAPLILTANVLSLGMAAPGTSGVKAGATTISIGGKTVGGSGRLGKIFVGTIKTLKSVPLASQLPKNVSVYRKVKSAIAIKRLGQGSFWLKKWGIRGLTASRTAKGIYEAQIDFSQAYADEFIKQTSQEINDEIDKHFDAETALYIKQEWGKIQLAEMAAANEFQIAQDVLGLVSVVDITGVTAVVAAYTKPICGADTPFPTLSQSYK